MNNPIVVTPINYIRLMINRQNTPDSAIILSVNEFAQLIRRDPGAPMVTTDSNHDLVTITGPTYGPQGKSLTLTKAEFETLVANGQDALRKANSSGGHPQTLPDTRAVAT